MELFQLELPGHFRLIPRDGRRYFDRYGLVEDFGNGRGIAWMLF